MCSRNYLVRACLHHVTVVLYKYDNLKLIYFDVNSYIIDHRGTDLILKCNGMMELYCLYRHSH